jgi:hypothetical protein
VIERKPFSVSGRIRMGSGLVFGLVVMLVVVKVFTVNDYDHTMISGGVRAMLSGVNPWAPESKSPGFFNPPFSVLFLWPMVFIPPKGMLVIGGASLFALLFYRRAWVAMAWFGMHTFLWIVSAGGIDMYVIGFGLILLALSDKCGKAPLRVLLRVVAYGFLLVKPQGGAFIVLLYILIRRDWVGAILSAVIYGLAFAPLYPDWISVVRTEPPISQTLAAHSLGARFGPLLTVSVAILVILARRWSYWQLGAALAGVLSPYGMPGIPILLVLTALDRLTLIPALLIYSGCLAVLTWVAPQSPFMGVYHLGMLGLALILAGACPGAGPEESDSIDARQWAGTVLRLARAKLGNRS